MKSGQATYSPEDNKLRLYVGRVPREEFLKLRAEGWVTLHKQREAGGGDFAATWTPQRRDTALEYAGIIEDEDMGPEERAADRAERFGVYRDKRTEEACGHADRYDNQPAAHGYQSEAKAERAAARHDRIGDRATDAWSKAEYWQRRTAGVIRHALYKSSPGVRMGRIKAIEAELRKIRANLDQYAKLYRDMEKIRAIADPAKQTAEAIKYTGSRHMWGKYMHPRAATHPREYYQKNETDLYSLLTVEQDPITGAEAVELFFRDNSEPKAENAWSVHLTLRLAYENQMLAAAGGMLEQFEVLPGGKLGSKLIIKVSKSSVTKRATSCDILGPKVSGWTYKAANIPGTEFAAYKFDLERISPDMYTPPTPESLAELKAFEAARKAGAPKKEACPLINPSDDEAEKLQKLWNDRARAAYEKYIDGLDYSQEYKTKALAGWTPSTVCRITQATYSANSKGSYSKAETRKMAASGILQATHYNAQKIEAVCQLRITWGDGKSGWSNHAPAWRVIVLTDKPRKPLPKCIWDPIREAVEAKAKPEANKQAEKFWNCKCGEQDVTSSVYDVKICPTCGEKMNDDTDAVLAERAARMAR